MRTSWNPFREMEALRREIDRLFSSAGRPGRASFLPGRSARGYPLVNVTEDAEAIHVDALMPGLDPATLEVTVKGDTLTLAGEKAPLADVRRESYHRNERAAGRFVRALRLEREIDASRVEASYQDGILSVTLPLAEQEKPRQISVQVS